MLLSFQDCIKKCPTNKKHILLGNGFSRACRDSIFSYDSLFDAADWKKDAQLKDVFNSLETRDFELVMETLEICALLAKPYGFTNTIAKKMKSDAKKLRTILVNTLAIHHPESPDEIQDSEYTACQSFLSNFERIYTVNYDLLLYWTFMKSKRQHDDGFRDPFEGDDEDYYEEDFVTWQNFENQQTIYYLHGALHLFLDKSTLQKFCWSRTGIKLKDQILASLDKRKYPLIVAAGKSEQKLGKIQRSNYLGHGFRSIRKISGSLFVYGLSMGDKDDHILDQIAGNTALEKLYIGIFGTPNSSQNKLLIEKANSIKTKNKKRKRELEILFYDSASAKVWGK